MAKKKVRAKKAPTRKRMITRRKVAAKAITAAVVLQASDVPAIGQDWPGQGGRRVGEIVGENGKPSAHVILVCGPDGKPIVLKNVSYGTYGVDTDAKSLRDGRVNLAALLKHDSPLAKNFDGKTFNGFADCYPPALCESFLIFGNGGNDLPKEWFLTSTQDGRYGARFQTFEPGLSGWSSKLNKYSCFVVRRVEIKQA